MLGHVGKVQNVGQQHFNHLSNVVDHRSAPANIIHQLRRQVLKIAHRAKVCAQYVPDLQEDAIVVYIR